MATPGTGDGTAGQRRSGEARDSSAYEVGVAIIPAISTRDVEHESAGTTGGIPGFDETLGWSLARTDDRLTLIEKGEEAVRAATEAIAAQIGLTAQRIAAAIEGQIDETANQGQLGLTSVEVSFGVTLSAGLQALFTAQTESSVLVTITLSRQDDKS